MPWSSDELKAIGSADELQVSSRRGDGTLRPYVTIWVVRVGDDILVRSAHGPRNGWYRRALRSGRGRVRAGSVERDVAFVGAAAGSTANAEVDRAYHTKYDRYGAAIVNAVVGPAVAGVTLKLEPA